MIIFPPSLGALLEVVLVVLDVEVDEDEPDVDEVDVEVSLDEPEVDVVGLEEEEEEVVVVA